MSVCWHRSSQQLPYVEDHYITNSIIFPWNFHLIQINIHVTQVPLSVCWHSSSQHLPSHMGRFSLWRLKGEALQIITQPQCSLWNILSSRIPLIGVQTWYLSNLLHQQILQNLEIYPKKHFNDIPIFLFIFFHHTLSWA